MRKAEIISILFSVIAFVIFLIIAFFYEYAISIGVIFFFVFIILSFYIHDKFVVS